MTEHATSSTSLQNLPEWQRRMAERLIELMDECGEDEEVRMVPYGRNYQWAWQIVKKP